MVEVSRSERLLLVANLILYGFLAIFSYAYVDLNLTLSQNQLILKFVSFMQQLGYYHRPEATVIYFVFLLFTFSFFTFNLWLFYKNKVGIKYLAISTLASTLTLIFAYPFLSSDLFNYLFDAKILLKYHLSPYTHKALDFPQDDWIRFMRWTHRYSPYGPLWLASSLIPAALGFGKFILNLFGFKVFIAIFHLVNSWLIFQTLKLINPRLTNFGTAFYALNPLFLIEGVANAHNDVVLTTFLIGSVFALSSRKPLLSFASLILGAAIKYIPVLNLPWVIWSFVYKRIDVSKLVILNLLTMTIFTYVFSSFRISVPFVSAGSTQIQFQPWYLFWTIPYVALTAQVELVVVSTALLVGASLRYLPYLYYGDWSHPNTTLFMTGVTFIPTLAIIALLVLRKYLPK